MARGGSSCFPAGGICLVVDVAGAACAKLGGAGVQAGRIAHESGFEFHFDLGEKVLEGEGPIAHFIAAWATVQYRPGCSAPDTPMLTLPAVQSSGGRGGAAL